ncbi:MAG: hypothetical protein ACREU8_00505 [Gammaproteobacteria bacterium]
MQLQSNKDLLEFLLRFATELEAGGETELAKDLLFASRFASGSASEFLHEAHQILARIDGSRPSVLTTEQSNDLKAVIIQINEAFRKIGGA